MKLKTLLSVFLLVALMPLTFGCAPKTFIRTMDPGWNAIEIREELSYDEAWKACVDLIARKFDIAILSKEDGYLRTGWLHSWTGKLKESYKVRAVLKFTPDKRMVEVKSEAHHYSTGLMGFWEGWEMGTDELLTTTLRTDIMGKVGRITR